MVASNRAQTDFWKAWCQIGCQCHFNFGSIAVASSGCVILDFTFKLVTRSVERERDFKDVIGGVLQEALKAQIAAAWVQGVQGLAGPRCVKSFVKSRMYMNQIRYGPQQLPTFHFCRGQSATTRSADLLLSYMGKNAWTNTAGAGIRRRLRGLKGHTARTFVDLWCARPTYPCLPWQDLPNFCKKGFLSLCILHVQKRFVLCLRLTDSIEFVIVKICQ